MKKWLKENLVLVSGIVLPVILVAAFFVLNGAPKLLTDPPEYDFVVVAYYYDYQHPANYSLSFEVRNEKLSGKVVPYNESNPSSRQLASIFLYESSNDAFKELTFDLPEDLVDLEEPVTLDLLDSDNLELDKRKQSPDGYSFEYRGYRGNGGLLGEMFGMRRGHESNYILKKGNAIMELPTPPSNTNYYRNDLHFMGWVTNQDSAE